MNEKPKSVSVFVDSRVYTKHKCSLHSVPHWENWRHLSDLETSQCMISPVTTQTCCNTVNQKSGYSYTTEMNGGKLGSHILIMGLHWCVSHGDCKQENWCRKLQLLHFVLLAPNYCLYCTSFCTLQISCVVSIHLKKVNNKRDWWLWFMQVFICAHSNLSTVLIALHLYLSSKAMHGCCVAGFP